MPVTATQVAGGLRSEAAVAAALEAGAARVVVGTAAIRDPAFFEQLENDVLRKAAPAAQH